VTSHVVYLLGDSANAPPFRLNLINHSVNPLFIQNPLIALASLLTPPLGPLKNFLSPSTHTFSSSSPAIVFICRHPVEEDERMGVHPQ